MAFPLNIFPIRFAVETTLFFFYPNLDNQPMKLLIAALTVGAAFGVAVILPEINLVFELIGATTGSFCCFIGPGFMFIRFKRGLPWSSKWQGYLLMTVGFVCLLLGTYSSVIDMIESLSGDAAPEPTCEGLIA